MSAEVIDALVIIGTLVVVWGAVAALFVSQIRAARLDLAEIRAEIGGDLRGFRGDIAEIRGAIRAMTNRIAYLHGYLIGTATREIQKPPDGS